jgi:CHAD domain-containing protein
LIRTQVERFERALNGVERGDAASLHKARVATRRLRELVPLMQLDADTAHKLSRRLRTVTHRLGAIREHDVLLAMIDELNDGKRASGDALARIGMAIARDRDAARKHSFDRVPLGDMRRLARKVRRRAKEFDAKGGRDARAVRWAVDARIARRSSALADALTAAGAVYLPERLHAARIAVKKLRYVLEAAGQSSDAHRREDIAALRRAQDALGRMHDLQVLVDRVRNVQATVAPPSVAIWRSLDAVVRQLDDECRRLHARYMRARPGLMTIAERLTAAFKPERGRPIPGTRDSEPGARNSEPGTRNPVAKERAG